MKPICFGLVLSLAGLGVAYADQPPAQQEAQLTIQDLDRQIQFLKDNIEKYNAMANAFDRKATSLQAHDYTGYRAAAAVRDECRGIADDLEKHMQTLEQQRANLEKQKSAK
jgi:hypothetical protein